MVTPLPSSGEVWEYPDDVVDDLSTDQYYAYRICLAVMTGTLQPDLALLEVGPMCHARWITLGGDLSDQEDESYNREVSEESRYIRKFKVPKINTKAKVYHKIVNMNSSDICEPPVISGLTDEEIQNIRQHKLVLKYPCHTQAVERHIKLK